MPWKTRLGVEVGHPVGGTLYFACVCVCVCVCFRWRFNVSRLAVVSVGPAGRVSDNNRTLVCFGRRTPRQRDDHRRRTEMLQPSLFLLPLLHRLLLLLDSSLSLSLSPLALERPSNNTTLPGSFVGTTRSVAAIHWSREGRRGIGSVRTNIFPPLKTPIRCQRVVLASSFLLLFLLFIYFFLFHFPSFPSPPPFIVSVRFSLEASKVVRPVRN